MSGDGTIIARVASLQNANSGAKAGVMIREKAQHGAVKFASMMLSGDGVNWQSVGSETISMGSTVYVGLAVTNQSATAQCTVTFDNVSAPGAP